MIVKVIDKWLDRYNRKNDIIKIVMLFFLVFMIIFGGKDKILYEKYVLFNMWIRYWYLFFELFCICIKVCIGLNGLKYIMVDKIKGF